MARLDQIFQYCKDSKGSDLHLTAGVEPRIRRHGQLEVVPGWPVLGNDQLIGLLKEVASPSQWRDFESSGDLDFAYGLTGVARFRCNYMLQERGTAAVFRIIPEKILTIEDLGLPPAVERLAHLPRGLVLVTGATGSGKSTTLAAIIDKMNRTHARHVVTIEDPVEFVHSNHRCVFSQREVGADTESFGAALRGAMRQDADVILVGEMRDRETISLAITAAEMGSLVFGTLHTRGAATTIDRLVDAFPADEQTQVRESLSESLTAIVAQLLLPTADGQGRVAALEILLAAPGLGNIIREGNTSMLRTLMQSGRKVGMQEMDDAILALLRAGKVSARDAYMKALDKERFEAQSQAS